MGSAKKEEGEGEEVGGKREKKAFSCGAEQSGAGGRVKSHQDVCNSVPPPDEAENGKEQGGREGGREGARER